MDHMPDRGSPKNKTFKGPLWTLLTLLTFFHLCKCNPSQPQVFNWELISSETGTPISTNTTHYQPIFQVDLCDILGQTDAAGRPWIGATAGNSLPWYGCGNVLREKGLQQV